MSLQRDGHVLLIGLNRPNKRNAFNRAMLTDLARAHATLESDAGVRAGVLFAHGDYFTGGLDLIDVAPAVAAGELELPDNAIPPAATTPSRQPNRKPTAVERAEPRRTRVPR